MKPKTYVVQEPTSCTATGVHDEPWQRNAVVERSPDDVEAAPAVSLALPVYTLVITREVAPWQNRRDAPASEDDPMEWN